MWKSIYVLLFAYLSGSVLYANVFGGLFGVRERYAESADKNPGTANAFTYGGFWCGILTLLGDVLKGAAPVFIALRMQGLKSWVLPLVLAAPVLGHICSVFHHFRGGKGIAVSFGVLLGLTPHLRPLAVLAAVFIFFSVCVRVSPHFYRTIVSFAAAAALMPLGRTQGWISFGFLMITALVCLRLLLSREEKEPLEVKLLWMR